MCERQQGGRRARDGRIDPDAVDTILIRWQRDGRATYAKPGREVGLSVPAVRARVQRLTERGVLQFAAVTVPLKPGRHPHRPGARSVESFPLLHSPKPIILFCVCMVAVTVPCVRENGTHDRSAHNGCR